MESMETVVPSTAVNLDGFSLKMEVVEESSPVDNNVADAETAVAPPSAASSDTLSGQPAVSSSSTSTSKRRAKKLRVPIHFKRNKNVLSKPATLFARPPLSNLSTILPHPAKSLIVSAPIISNTVATVPTNTNQPFTTYLVVDGNQGQFVQVANDGKQPVTFRNQTGQILQATPINVLAANASNPVSTSISSFPINTDCSLLSNSSQTVTTVRTSSSIDMQQKMLTSDTTTTTTQQMTGILHQPNVLPSNSIISTTVLNGNGTNAFDGNTLGMTRASDSDVSLSLSQLAERVNQRERRLSSSSLSKKRRGRPRLYEREPFPSKTNDNGRAERTEITVPNITPSTLIIPGVSTINNLPNQNYNPIIFSPMSTNSTTPTNSYSYPSLLNNKAPTMSLLNGSNMNLFQNSSNSTKPSYSLITSSPVTNSPFSLSTNVPAAEPACISPLRSLQVTNTQPLTQSSSIVSLSTPSISPRKSSNPDTAIHYIGGYIIKESSQPFSHHDDAEQNTKSGSHNDQSMNYLQCAICQTVNLASRFYDATRLACTKICSITLLERTLINDEKSILDCNRDFSIENQSPNSNNLSKIDESIIVSPNHGLPMDPSRWTVTQVAEFIGRLTNKTVRDAFYESEIDGQALLLMTPEHLRDTLKIKLGPSLIIASEIAKLRDRDKK